MTNFSGLLGILFIGLKLSNHITWPWVWVVSPLWIPIAISIAIMLLTFGTAILALIVKEFVKYLHN